MKKRNFYWLHFLLFLGLSVNLLNVKLSTVGAVKAEELSPTVVREKTLVDFMSTAKLLAQQKQQEDEQKSVQKQIALEKAYEAKKVQKKEKEQEAIKTSLKKTRATSENVKKKLDKKIKSIKVDNLSSANVSSDYISYKIGSAGDSAKKTYMYYTAVTDKSSKQYKLLNSKRAYTGVHGIRMYKKRFCIAVGTHYAKKVGTAIDVYLDNGCILPCIVGDIKSDKHTDSTHSYQKKDGSYVEFIMDKKKLPDVVKARGSLHVLKGFQGTIKQLRVYK